MYPPSSPPSIFRSAPETRVPAIPTHVVAPNRIIGPNPDLLDLDIRIDPVTQRKYLHFDYQAISDIHWGSKFCRAKRLCMALRDFRPERRDIVGDGFGGEETTKKDSWHIGPYHRRGVAMVIEDAENRTKTGYQKGNHEVGADKYWDSSKTVFGIKFQRESTYTDAQGRVFLVAHGDKFDKKLVQKLYSFGDRLLQWGGEVDHFLQENKIAQKLIEAIFKVERASVSNWVKRRFKTTINKTMGILKTIEAEIDSLPYAGLIFGHSHMMGVHRTPAGKLLINDGCCTDHIQFLVEKNGKKALIEHHRDRMNIEMVESGKKYMVFYKDVGLEEFGDEPLLVENEYTKKADRLMRLAFRIWPALDRRQLKETIEKKQHAIDRLFQALTKYDGAAEPVGLFTALGRTEEELTAVEKLYRSCPIPRHKSRVAPKQFANAA